MISLDKIDKENTSEFVHNLLDYYSEIDKNSINIVHEEQSDRDLPGWYHYKDGKHYIHLSIPNIMRLESAVNRGSLDINGYYAFLTIIVGHEFRHFLQARHNKDGIELDGYTEEDILLDELIIYIKMFFNNYYLMNRGFIKAEVDADKFALEHGFGYLTQFSDIDVNSAILMAVNHYAYLHYINGVMSTVPSGSKSFEEVMYRVDRRLKDNLRTLDIEETLTASDPKCLELQKYCGLRRKKLLQQEFIDQYRDLVFDGSKQDLLVARRILKLVKNPDETLTAFPEMRKKLRRD